MSVIPATAMSHYKIEAGTGQHIGDQHEQQDRTALFTAPRAPGYVIAVVADGMGGMSGGALAAEQVIRTAKQAFDLFSPQTDDVVTMLETIARDANTIIRLTAIASEKKPYSTMVILVITPDKSAIWTHVGDSRLYRFDGPNCAECTTDHSYPEQLPRQAALLAGRAQDHAPSDSIPGPLGAYEHAPTVTVRRLNGLKAGDSFLLCTDGLWRHFGDTELGAAVAVNTPRQASEMLIAKARERAAGSQADNCTLAIVKLVEPQKEIKGYTVGRMKRAV